MPGCETFNCLCNECKKHGPKNALGTPIGRNFTSVTYTAHLQRLYLEQEKDTSGDQAIYEAKVFTSTVSDEGPEIDLQPHQLWASRREFQSLVPEQRMPEDVPMDIIMDSAQQLRSEENPYPQQIPFKPSSGSSNSRLVRPLRRDKRETNQHTVRAHRVLEDIGKTLNSCSQKLHSSPNLDIVKRVASQISNASDRLNKVTRQVTSVIAKKRELYNRIQELNALVLDMEQLRSVEYTPLQFNSDHHYNLPVDSKEPAAQLTMFLGVVMSVMVGAGRRAADMVLQLVKMIITLALKSPLGTLTERQTTILNQIPSTVGTAMDKFNLEPKTTTYAVCPVCHCTYPPAFLSGSSTPVYPSHCSNSPKPDSGTCGASLLDINEDGSSSLKPIKTFVYHSFHDYLAGILSQKDLETAMNSACDTLMNSIRENKDTPELVTDPFEAEFLRSFEGPDSGMTEENGRKKIEKRLFVDRPGKEGRYAFAFSFDFFATEGLSLQGPSASCGILSAACLNIPLHLRYKPENMYIAGIIPGPKEPHEDELDHYVRIVVDDLLVSWERGVYILRTANHPDGRNTRCAMAISVNDLPASRKLLGSGWYTSHHFCTRCNLVDPSNYGDINVSNWKVKDRKYLHDKAKKWLDASTTAKRKALFKENGQRWSLLWRLPYWDQANMLVVDSMHCLLEGLVQYHFRHVLKLQDVDALKDDKAQAFSLDPLSPDELYVKTEDLSKNDLKHIPQIYRNLVAPIPIVQIKKFEEQKLELRDQLQRKNLKALRFVTESLGIRIETFKLKVDYADALVNWRIAQPLVSQDTVVKFGTPDTMEHIRAVIRNTVLPSWISLVPYNYGKAAAGTLKADEWRTLANIHFPIALVSIWGEGSKHQSTAFASSVCPVLDHTMRLVAAILIACMRTMTKSRMDDYFFYISLWLAALPVIHPDMDARPNCHMAMHIYNFLTLYGPVKSWWCFPFERLVGQLQRIPHNHKFGYEALRK